MTFLSILLGQLPEELQLTEMVKFVAYVRESRWRVMGIEIGRSSCYADLHKHCYIAEVVT